MRINYALTVHQGRGGQELLRAELVGRLFPPSVCGISHDDEDLYEERAERIALGVVLYPQSGANGKILPPLLLIEPVDDPDMAAQRYSMYGGIRYVGQFLLNDGVLAESVEIKASRAALDLWWRLLPLSELHYGAFKRYKQWKADLLRPTHSAMRQVRASEVLQGSLHVVWEVLRHGSEQDRVAILHRLHHAERNVFPPSILLPCLGDSSAEVRTLALRLLEARVKQLPVKRLIAIAEGAEVQARLAAISLLGKIGGEEAVSALFGARWSRHAWIRSAAFSALVEADSNDSDVLENLLIAYRKDDATVVRQTVSALIDRLGGLAMVEARSIAQLRLH